MSTAEDAAPAPGSPPEGAAAGAPAPATPADRWILAAFGAYVALLLVAAWAQLSNDRALLDLLDLRRFFTR